jgi:integrase
LDKPAAAVDRSAVVRVLDRLSEDDRAAMAAATARYGSALYGWAIRRGTLSVNPFQRVPVSPTVRRERVLSDDEIRRVRLATEGPGAFNGIVRTLMLTGQRREEMPVVWDEIAPDLSAWTVPASQAKNGVAHLVPLSPLAQTILRVAPRFAEKAMNRRSTTSQTSCFPANRACSLAGANPKLGSIAAAGSQAGRRMTRAARWPLGCKSPASGLK